MSSIWCTTPTDTCVHVLQSAAVQTQTARVQQLQSQAATGKVSVKCVEKEQNVLSKMTVSYSHMTNMVSHCTSCHAASHRNGCAECAMVICDCLACSADALTSKDAITQCLELREFESRLNCNV